MVREAVVVEAVVVAEEDYFHLHVDQRVYWDHQNFLVLQTWTLAENQVWVLQSHPGRLLFPRLDSSFLFHLHPVKSFAGNHDQVVDLN